MSPITNGRGQRPSLAQQIDRLDGILDNLSEGLQEAVAEAVKLAVTKAVEAALMEVLTNPELRLHLMPEPQVTPARTSESRWENIAGFVRRSGCRVRAGAIGLWSAVPALIVFLLAAGQNAYQHAKRRLTSVTRTIWYRAVAGMHLFRQVRRSLGMALGIGVLVGVGCFVAGPVVASAVSGVAGFLGSLATVLRCRRFDEQVDQVQQFNERVL
jgi:hypothetical protein